jgi:hypothetical protein
LEVPFTAAGAEHVAAHDVGPRAGDRVDLGAVLIAVVEHPGVQLLVFEAFAERQFFRLVRPGRKAVQRHGDVCGDCGHAGTDHRRARKSSNPLCSVSVRGIVD